MKSKLMSRIMVCIFAIIFACQLSMVTFAHPSSQEGILAKTYISDVYSDLYGDYFIGGDSVGWSINENHHTNGTTLTYSFSTTDSYLTSTLKSYVTSGASKWSGTVSIVNKSDGSGTGEISTFYNAGTSVGAKFCDFLTDSSGHLTSWYIQMNRYYTQSAVTIAHEFGHAIGLNDLYGNISSNKLMYGFSGRTATSPTSADKWGAKVITGAHTSHTWGYKYYDTTSAGANRHVKYCTQCNGLTTTIANCVYNTNNICKICGVAYGTSPSSVGHEIL